MIVPRKSNPQISERTRYLQTKLGFEIGGKGLKHSDKQGLQVLKFKIQTLSKTKEYPKWFSQFRTNWSKMDSLDRFNVLGELRGSILRPQRRKMRVGRCFLLVHVRMERDVEEEGKKSTAFCCMRTRRYMPCAVSFTPIDVICLSCERWRENC